MRRVLVPFVMLMALLLFPGGASADTWTAWGSATEGRSAVIIEFPEAELNRVTLLDTGGRCTTQGCVSFTVKRNGTLLCSVDGRCHGCPISGAGTSCTATWNGILGETVIIRIDAPPVQAGAVRLYHYALSGQNPSLVGVNHREYRPPTHWADVPGVVPESLSYGGLLGVMGSVLGSSLISGLMLWAVALPIGGYFVVWLVSIAFQIAGWKKGSGERAEEEAYQKKKKEVDKKSRNAALEKKDAQAERSYLDTNDMREGTRVKKWAAEMDEYEASERIKKGSAALASSTWKQGPIGPQRPKK